jgi:hypothetical protein
VAQGCSGAHERRNVEHAEWVNERVRAEYASEIRRLMALGVEPPAEDGEEE